MCGIAGYVDWRRGEDLREVTGRMMMALARRGPDSEGLQVWEGEGGRAGAALGHRRLAILDLSPLGAQPYFNEDRSMGLVFNGCIYNFREVREELIGAGLRFESQCDTEVLMKGLEHWGVDALMPRLRGMFAFALWEQKAGRLTLVRDRLGVKPLVYARRGRGIGFASTVDGLRRAGLVGEMDPMAVLEYLEYGVVTDTRCIFTGVEKLPPATILEWQNGEVRQRSYWTLDVEERPEIGFEEAVERTEELLIEAVKLRLIADVPVGALLSGGIDSSLVCWAMSRLNANVKAFTVSAPDDASDESAVAAATARKLGIEHEVIPLPRQSTGVLKTLTEAYSEPFAANSALGMLLVSEAVKPSATVLLTGDGGDEVYLGYPSHRNAYIAQQLARAMPEMARAGWEAYGGRVPEWGPLRRLKNLMNYATEGLSGYARAHDGLPYFEQRGLIGEPLKGLRLEQREMVANFGSAKQLLRDALAFHRQLHFLGEFLPKVDQGTMFHSLESRAPLLDHKVWEYASRLPVGVRLRRWRLKAVLREITKRRLGADLAYRRKQGFTVPVEVLLVKQWRLEIEELRGGTLLEDQGWIQKGSLRKAIDEALGKGWVPLQLWYLVVIEAWLRNKV